MHVTKWKPSGNIPPDRSCWLDLYSWVPLGSELLRFPRGKHAGSINHLSLRVKRTCLCCRQASVEGVWKEISQSSEICPVLFWPTSNIQASIFSSNFWSKKKKKKRTCRDWNSSVPILRLMLELSYKKGWFLSPDMIERKKYIYINLKPQAGFFSFIWEKKHCRWKQSQEMKAWILMTSLEPLDLICLKLENSWLVGYVSQ